MPERSLHNQLRLRVYAYGVALLSALVCGAAAFALVQSVTSVPHLLCRFHLFRAEELLGILTQ